MKRDFCIALIGPTASGKTSFAVELAEKMGGEIVCLDSTTVYKGFDIGSSKPTPEERAKVPHHMVDVLEPDEGFSAYHFVHETDQLLNDISQRGKQPIIVGGTYFYLRALQHGMYNVPVIPTEVIDGIEREYFDDETVNTERMHQSLETADPASAAAIHPNDKYRLVRALALLRTTGEKPSSLKPVQTESQKNRLWLKYALLLSRHVLSINITRRTEKMLQNGLVEETRRLKEAHPQARALGSIGYCETVAFLNRKLTEKQLRVEIIEKTRQLAKRQMTWLRSDTEVRYIDHRDKDRVLKEVENLGFALS